MSDKYAAIQTHRDRFPVRLMCAVLGVSVSGCYDAVARQAAAPSAHAVADERLRLHVRAAHRRSRQRYGAPRVHRELQAQGVPVAHKRVARLMREDGLGARGRRRFVVTTDSAHAEPIAPNRLARRFDLAAHPQPDRAWVGEIVCSQLTKPGVRTLGAGWEHVADLDLAIGHDHPVDEEQHELAALVGGGGRQPLGDPGTERLERRRDTGQLLLARRVAAKLCLVRRERIRPLRQVAASTLVLVEREDLPKRR